jgi:hypothetical protein
MNNNTLIRYIRNENGAPEGVAIAQRRGDEVFYGFSLHNPIDKWDKNEGIKIAIARSEADTYKLPRVSDRALKVLQAFDHLSNRAVKYFKDLPIENVAFGIDYD